VVLIASAMNLRAAPFSRARRGFLDVRARPEGCRIFPSSASSQDGGRISRHHSSDLSTRERLDEGSGRGDGQEGVCVCWVGTRGGLGRAARAAARAQRTRATPPRPAAGPSHLKIDVKSIRTYRASASVWELTPGARDWPPRHTWGMSTGPGQLTDAGQSTAAGAWGDASDLYGGKGEGVRGRAHTRTSFSSWSGSTAPMNTAWGGAAPREWRAGRREDGAERRTDGAERNGLRGALQACCVRGGSGRALAGAAPRGGEVGRGVRYLHEHVRAEAVEDRGGLDLSERADKGALRDAPEEEERVAECVHEYSLRSGGRRGGGSQRVCARRPGKKIPRGRACAGAQHLFDDSRKKLLPE
jgi:hypothetical protein